MFVFKSFNLKGVAEEELQKDIKRSFILLMRSATDKVRVLQRIKMNHIFYFSGSYRRKIIKGVGDEI